MSCYVFKYLARFIFSRRTVLLLIAGCWFLFSLQNPNSQFTQEQQGQDGNLSLQESRKGAPALNYTQDGADGKQDEKQGDMKKVMRDRVNILKTACKKHGLNRPGADKLHQPDPWEFIVNREHGLVWCNVFKSASSTWMYIFNVLAGYDQKFLTRTKKVPLQLARDKYGRPSLEQVQRTVEKEGAVAFLVGRNPLERLVSAFRDKIQNALPRSEHDKLRRKITEISRHVQVPTKVRQLPAMFIPTFQEFVEYVVKEYRRGSPLDMHWSPVYKFCTPCQFDWTDIILFETQFRDSTYILKKAGVYEQVEVVQRNPAKGPERTAALTYSLVSQLPAALYSQLIEIYRIDFELFNYTVPAYDDLKHTEEDSSTVVH